MNWAHLKMRDALLKMVMCNIYIEQNFSSALTCVFFRHIFFRNPSMFHSSSCWVCRHCCISLYMVQCDGTEWRNFKQSSHRQQLWPRPTWLCPVRNGPVKTKKAVKFSPIMCTGCSVSIFQPKKNTCCRVLLQLGRCMWPTYPELSLKDLSSAPSLTANSFFDIRLAFKIV